MTILIKSNNFDVRVINFIYDKQLEFKKEKGCVVSLEKTVEKLIKDAYPDDINNIVIPPGKKQIINN